MPRKLTRENHREWVDRLLEAAYVYEGIPGRETSKASYYELIGNVYWEFDRPRSKEWFQRTLELRRTVGWEPNWLTITLLSKLGDGTGLREEYRRIVEINEPRLRDLRATGPAADTFRERERLGKVRAAFHELAIAPFLAKDFAEAERWAETALDDGQPGLYTQEAIRDMAKAIPSCDSGLFARGMELLRKHLEMWPSDAGNLQTELYRYGMTLAPEHFPSAP